VTANPVAAPMRSLTEAAAGAAARLLPRGNLKLYLALTFWGEEYRRYFLDFCLASLLAPGNIPAIADKGAARLLVATTADDWRALQTEPTFIAARKHLAIEHIPFDADGFSKRYGKMLVMSRAHRLLTRRMFEDSAQGVFIFPDMIAATGFIASIEARWRKGAKAIVFMNVRFANESLIREVEQRGLLRPGEPLALSSRELVRLTLRHMHSEMMRSGFENKFRDHECASFFWSVGREDLLFHCGSWIPLLIDYRHLARHDDTTFDQWTLDGDYIARNVTDLKDIHVVLDTDDLLLISFTPESKVHYSLTPILPYRFPRLRKARKIVGAYQFLYKQVPMDWLRRDLFRRPVRFRGGEASEAAWRAQEREAGLIIERIEQGGRWSDWILSSYVYPVRLLLHTRDFIMVRAKRFRAWRTGNRAGRQS
jgi:hypothetical protein